MINNDLLNSQKPLLSQLILSISTVFIMMGILMIIPILVDLSYNQNDWKGFAIYSIITISTGFSLYLASAGADLGQLTLRNAFVVTASIWLSLSILGALPLLTYNNSELSIAGGLFESISGLTTTGASVMNNLESSPIGIILWRSILQWIGGLGIVIMAAAVFPILQIGGMQFFQGESYPTADKIMPKARQFSTWLSAAYTILTFACTIFYFLAGMSWIDSFSHALTTVSTGGFSPYSSSLGHFNSWKIEIVACIFMIMAALPHTLFVRALNLDIKSLLYDTQIRLFLYISATFILLVWLYEISFTSTPPLKALMDATFNIISNISGTGFTTSDYSSIGPFVTGLFLMTMLIGGCAGSTSCGIKIFRFQILATEIKYQIKRVLYPNAIFVRKIDGKVLDNVVVSAVVSFMFMYICLFIFFAILLKFTGLDSLSAFSVSASTLSNVGPGLGPLVGPSQNLSALTETAKWITCLAMLLGRLEIYTIGLLLMPSFWRQ